MNSFGAILLAFLVVGLAPVKAQKKIWKSEETREVVINEENGYSKVEILKDEKEIRIDMSKLYHWFHGNKVLQTTGGYEGKLLHGQFVSFYSNKQLKEKGHFQYGLKNGQWTSWYNDGQLKAINHWEDGEKEGLQEEFDENGDLQYSMHYIDGIPNEGGDPKKKRSGEGFKPFEKIKLFKKKKEEGD